MVRARASHAPPCPSWHPAWLRFDRRGLIRDIASAALLGLVGDVACQVAVERRVLLASATTASAEPFDPRRVASLTIFNAGYVGGFLHFLYQAYTPAVGAVATRLPVAEAVRARLLRPRSLPHALGCALVDNVHCGSVYIPAFFVGTGLLQGHGLAAPTANLRAEWWTTYASCTAFWIPFMWFNFAVVPAERRVQAMATANLAWTVVIDYIAHRGVGDAHPSATAG